MGASPDVARLASRLARSNNFVGVTDEDIAPGSVDVIISEIFSHFLVGELGLQVVTRAKQRFLKQGGLVLPAVSHMRLAPYQDPELGAELRARHLFWQNSNFYGFDLTAALPLAMEL